MIFYEDMTLEEAKIFEEILEIENKKRKLMNLLLKKIKKYNLLLRIKFFVKYKLKFFIKDIADINKFSTEEIKEQKINEILLFLHKNKKLKQILSDKKLYELIYNLTRSRYFSLDKEIKNQVLKSCVLKV